MEKRVVEVLAQSHPSFVVVESAGQDPVISVCQEMISRALDFCSQKSNFLGGNGIADALREGNLAAHDYFRYGLAKEIGSYLGNELPTVKTVYFFEPEAMPGEMDGRWVGVGGTGVSDGAVAVPGVGSTVGATSVTGTVSVTSGD